MGLILFHPSVFSDGLIDLPGVYESINPLAFVTYQEAVDHEVDEYLSSCHQRKSKPHTSCDRHLSLCCHG